MDKPRHPHVVRTWTVERTKVAIHGPVQKPGKATQPAGKRRAPKKTEPRP